MHSTFALATLAAIAYAAPQGTTAVTQSISPPGAAPAGAQTSYPGAFELTLYNITSPSAKRDVVERQATTCGQAGVLTVTLTDSVLKDSQQRTGYIAANYQFQYDGPPQAGAIYTAGFSILKNGSLALGPSAVFYSCYTGGFSNLYDRHVGNQCVPVILNIVPCAGSSTGSQPVSQISDGQPQATSAAPKPVSQISDGQVQATSAAPKPISQISDGQIQATAAAKPLVSQISDGQIQATTAAPKPPISQISDGQIQATTAAPKPPVSQISDGQIQATAAANASATPISFTGAGNVLTAVSTVATLFFGATVAFLL